METAVKHPTCASFTVHDVSPVGNKPFTQSIQSKVEETIEVRPEASSHWGTEIISEATSNGLVAAALFAYNTHRDLLITPDAVWTTLLQGLAKHIGKNAEALRHNFVTHEGKMKLDVRRDEFIKGSPDNDWPGVFAEFSQKIQAELVDDTRNLLLPSFSTTGPTEKAAFEVGLMDAMQSYFEYHVYTRCGIPNIHLSGTVEDWLDLRSRFYEFGRFGLTGWVDRMKEVLDEFVLAAKGFVYEEHWKSIIHTPWRGSGGTTVDGWLLKFFPYIKEREYIGGPKQLSDVPCGLSSVPFVWHYHEQELKYNFYAGTIGAVLDAEPQLSRPLVSWFVAPEKDPNANRDKLAALGRSR